MNEKLKVHSLQEAHIGNLLCDLIKENKEPKINVNGAIINAFKVPEGKWCIGVTYEFDNKLHSFNMGVFDLEDFKNIYRWGMTVNTNASGLQ